VRSSAFYWRAFTTFLVVLGFFVLAGTGVGLYLTPPGRIANWSGWTLGGLTKTQWEAVHMVFGLLFVVAGGFHLFFNWRVLLSYLRKHLTEGLRRKREIAWSLATTTALLALAIGDVPPVSAIAALRETVSNSWSDASTEPPIPHAELLTLARVAESQKLPLESALATLRDAGASVTHDTTLADVAVQLGISPQEVFRTLGVTQPAASPVGGGMGWKTLRVVSDELGIPLETATARLTSRGIAADADATLRDMASRHDTHAPALVNIIKGEQ
jgi:hypothetical protein